MDSERVVLRISPEMHNLYKCGFLPTSLIRKAFYAVVYSYVPQAVVRHKDIKGWPKIVLSVEEQAAERYKNLAFKYRPYFHTLLNEELKRLIREMQDRISTINGHKY